MGQALSTPELQERVDLLLGPTGYAFSYGFSQFGKCFPSSEPDDSPPTHPWPRATANTQSIAPYIHHRLYPVTRLSHGSNRRERVRTDRPRERRECHE